MCFGTRMLSPFHQRQGTPPVQEVKWKFIDLKLSSPEKWLISCKPAHLLIKAQWGDISASAHAFLAFLGHLWFSMGNIKVARWNGLKILIPKHMWKSKIGLLEQIWGQNPYVAFFLGHPVWFWWSKWLCNKYHFDDLNDLATSIILMI